MLVRLSIVFLTSVFTLIQAHAFDCSNALLDAEKLICQSSDLKSKDDTLNALYKKKLDTAKSKAAFAKTQQDWLTGVRDACKDEACLTRAYAARLDQLDSSSTIISKTSSTTKSKRDYFCWENQSSQSAPKFMEIAFTKDNAGDFINVAQVKKSGSKSVIKIVFKKTLSTNKTASDRPLEFVQLWVEVGKPKHLTRYEITSQNFPRSVKYYPDGSKGMGIGYVPLGIPSDESCFRSAVSGQLSPQ